MLLCTLVIFLIISISSPCQSEESRPVIRAPKVDTPPRIDGLLSDPVWSTVEPITDFIQQEPEVGITPVEKAEVRICYDSRFLYIGIRAYDSEPEKVLARIFERDGPVHRDDSFAIMIDSLRDRRTAFVFLTNSLGTQTDGQITAGKVRNDNWNTIWYSKGNVDSEGFTIEVAIPFFVLRFKEQEEVSLGILISRNIPRRSAWAYWPGLSRDYDYFSMEMYATLADLRGIERGVDLEIKPYAIAGRTQTTGGSDIETDAGLDIKWGVTSNLTADFTFNTDFAQVESDDLQIRTDRFSLYYPEKRDFFIESEDLFHFGLREEAHVFFSRRIGIRETSEVPILGGARLYGLVGNTNVGLMTMQTRDSGGIPGENFTVARVKQNVFSRSYFGGIVTSRVGYGSEEDQTWGMDFAFLHGPNAGLTGAIARSGGPGIEENQWFGHLAYFNLTDRFEARAEYTDIGPNFEPGIGFIQRPDQRTAYLYGAYNPRPAWPGVRQLVFSGDYTRTYNYNGEVENSKFMHWTMFRFTTGDEIRIAAYYQEEFIPCDFEYAPGVVILRGQYEVGHVGIGIVSSDSRKIVGLLILARGGFYDGDLGVAQAFLDYKPVPRLQFGVGTQNYFFNLPDLNFTHSVHNAQISYYFSPFLTTKLIAQYDTLYKNFFLNFRLRWIYAPGSEAWLVYDEGRRYDILGPSLQDRALILKVVYNFNF